MAEGIAQPPHGQRVVLAGGRPQVNSSICDPDIDVQRAGSVSCGSSWQRSGRVKAVAMATADPSVGAVGWISILAEQRSVTPLRWCSWGFPWEFRGGESGPISVCWSFSLGILGCRTSRLELPCRDSSEQGKDA